MANVHIEWLSDEHDCETCGYSYAEGAIVRIDGELVVELLPSAHCYGGESYSESDIFKAILQKLGHEYSEDLAYEIVES